MVPYTRIVVMEVVRGGQTLDIFWKWSPRNYIWCIEFGVWNKEQSQHLFKVLTCETGRVELVFSAIKKTM